MGGGVVQVKGRLIDIALAQGEEIRLRVVTADLKTQATGLKARRGGVFEDHSEEFIDLLRIDFENDNDIDHGRPTEAIFD